MIVTKWTMRRFHIASLLVLICARMVQGLPTSLPPLPQPETASTETKPPTSDEAASTAAPPTPAKEEGNFFQGDIRLTAEDDPYDLFSNVRVFKRTAFDGSGAGETNSSALNARLWPDGYVPYVYHHRLTMDYRNIFEDAITVWESATCINFVRISDENITESDYLILTDRAGCSSYVGRIGGPQEVSIGDGCDAVGHALHELGHAVGLWHEHSRWDRNLYIRIIRENIKENAYYNFGTLSEEKWSHIPDVGYDLLSIMHYGAKAFNRNGLDTIEVTVTVDECAINKMGQRVKLSKKDKLRTSMMYNCENETRKAENSQEKCTVELTEPTPTTRPVTTKLLTDDLLRLNTNASLHESLFCTEHRCYKKRCTFNPFFDILICDEGIDFSIHRYTQRKNKKIKNDDVVNIKSLHKSSRWLECNGQNICALSECSANNGNISSNISECQDQRFKIVSTRTTLKTGSMFKLKHEFNETFLYCNRKWCDLLPQCPEGEIESNSLNRDDVTCHSPTEFYVQKLET